MHGSLEVEGYLNESMQKNSNGSWECLSCGYSSRQKHHVKNHIESKHINLQYSCQYCSKTCPSSHALEMHIHRNHKA